MHHMAATPELQTAVMEVVRSDDIEGLEALLRQHQGNEVKVCAFNAAVGSDRLLVAQYLVKEWKVDPHDMEPNPLIHAAGYKALRCTAWLMSAGVKLPSIPKPLRPYFPPLAFAARCRHTDKSTIKTLLKDQYCRLEDKDGKGMTALAGAIKFYNWESAAILLKAGARVVCWRGKTMHDLAQQVLIRNHVCPQPIRHLFALAQIKEAKRLLVLGHLAGRAPPQKKKRKRSEQTWVYILGKAKDVPDLFACILDFL